MKKYLLPEEGRFYKANLHAHSTVSDGTFSPAELKAMYKSRGYSVLACTDHELLVPHHELTDDGFVMITGFELGFEERWHAEFLHARVCDINMLAIDPENDVQPCFNPAYFSEEKKKLVRYDPNEAPFVKEYNPDCINEAIKIGREKGFFVTYNHPHWSLERYEQYSKYRGMHAMEICNYSSLIDGYDEYNGPIYDDLLRQGKRLFVLGTDDNHNRRDPKSRMWDSFGAFTMIKAPRLDYRSITDALVKGNFYASQGPEIHALWLEDDVLHVRCSPADKVVCTVNQRRCMSRYAEQDLDDPNAAAAAHVKFELLPDDVYFRVTVIDKNGLRADTNAYFTEDWLDAKA